MAEDGDVSIIGKRLDEIRSIHGDLIAAKKITEEDIINECYCMNPEFLNDSLEKSLNTKK